MDAQCQLQELTVYSTRDLQQNSEKQCCTHAIHHWIATLFGMVMMFPDQLFHSMPQKSTQITSLPEQYKYQKMREAP